MSALRNKILGATFAGMAALTAPIQAIAEQDNTPMQLATLQQTNPILRQEAIDLSAGQVVLYYGADVTQLDLNVNVKTIESMGLKVTAYPSATANNNIDLFFYGHDLQKTYAANDLSLTAYVYQLGVNYNLISNEYRISNDNT